jgi:hypothetical protein
VLILVVAILNLDLAVPGGNLLNQARSFALAAATCSRLNTAFVSSKFPRRLELLRCRIPSMGSGGWPPVTRGGPTPRLVALGVEAIAGRRAVTIDVRSRSI